MAVKIQFSQTVVGSQRNYLEDAGGTGHPEMGVHVWVKVTGGPLKQRFTKKIAGSLGGKIGKIYKLYKCVFFWGGQVE